MFRNIIFLLLAGSLGFSCGKLPTPEPGQEFEHFVADFENGTFDGMLRLFPNDSSAVIVSSPVRHGNKAVRFRLRTEDRVNHGNRVELGFAQSAKYKTDVYYGWSFLIDTSYHDPHYCLLAQWQNLPNYQMGEDWDNTIPSSPPLHLVLLDSVLEIAYNASAINQNPQTLASIPVGKGNWNDIVFHMYWSDDNTGFVEAWLNGAPMISGGDHKFYGSNLYSRAGNYFKFGLYRGHDSDEHTPLIIYCDEVKIGTSYAEVAP